MRVSFITQTVVTDIVGRVNRALHGAQKRSLNDVTVGFVLHRFNDFFVVRGGGFVAARKRQTKTGQGASDLQKLIGRRRVVHTVETKLFVARDKVRGARVCREHHLFDEPVGVVGFARDDCHNVALLIGFNFRFLRCKVNRTAHASGFSQDFIKSIEIIEAAPHSIGHFLLSHLFPAQILPSVGVRESGLRVNHGRIELISAHHP